MSPNLCKGQNGSGRFNLFFLQLQGMTREEYAEKIHKVKTQFEAEVVRPVEAVTLGLNKDTVYWQKGLLSTPPVSRFTHRLQHSCIPQGLCCHRKLIIIVICTALSPAIEAHKHAFGALIVR